LSDYYYPVLAFHIIAVLSWMSMLFYLPRLYVYHQENKEKEQFVEVVKIQEFKLYKYIGMPAMWITILTGSFLLYNNPELLKEAWMHAKLFLLVLLIIYSISLEYYRQQLAKDICNKNGKFFRAYNEVPTLLAILIVTYVINKSVPVLFSVGITIFFIFITYMILKKKTQTDKTNKETKI